MRNMADPHLGTPPQPKKYGGKYWADPADLKRDHGGVHINSGVGNHTAYLLATKIGIYDTCRLVFDMLKHLSPRSGYVDVVAGLRAEVDEKHSAHLEAALVATGLAALGAPKSS